MQLICSIIATYICTYRLTIYIHYLYFILFKGNKHIPHDLMGDVDSMVLPIYEECLLNHQRPT